MPVDEERLLAWLDGELGEEDAAVVAAAVAADPELAALAEAHRAVASRLRAGFDPLLAADVPPELRAPLDGAASGLPHNVNDLSAFRAARTAEAPRTRQPQWAAIAATLAIGIIAGRTSTSFGPQPLLTQTEAGLEANGQLASALDTQLASAPASGNGVRVLLTFRGQDGQICRTWTGAGQDGIACRQDGGWRVAATFSTASERTGDYRMAGANNPLLLAALDDLRTGDPFDAQQEREAKANAWR